MALRRRSAITTWSLISPPVSIVVLAAAWGRGLGPVLMLAVAVALIGAALAAVHHSEVVARRVGEPFGSLVVAVAVTVIQVGLIVVLMTAGDAPTASLARDTVFAAVMITVNGIVGLSLFVGARRPAPRGRTVQPEGYRRRPRHCGLTHRSLPGVAHLHGQPSQARILPG